jgi:methionyl aminopeptidase
MIFLKTAEEIEVMAKGGEILASVMAEVIKEIKSGMITSEIDQMVESKILARKAKPSFKMVPGYSWATCLTLNDEVVHGIPGNKTVKKGDILGIDMGVYFGGFHTDMSRTIEIKSSSFAKASNDKEKLKIKSPNDIFLETGELALKQAIAEVKPGNHVGHISQAIQLIIESAGYSVVRELTGHGIGRKLHEDPMIPSFLDREIEKTPLLKAGMVLAIEVIYNQGSPKIALCSDGWTIKTKDDKISALFEDTVAITANGSFVLTKYKS